MKQRYSRWRRVSVARWAITSVLACFVGGAGPFSRVCTRNEPGLPREPLPPIALALRYLTATQQDMDRRVGQRQDYAGDWPQCFGFSEHGPFVRDISPFMPAFIHHALAFIHEGTQNVLALSDADVAAARRARQRTVELMLRFEAESGELDAGTFGFWPDQRSTWRPGDRVLGRVLDRRWEGPEFMGYRAPTNVSFYPEDFAIPTDADVTAVVYAALLDAAELDGGAAVSLTFHQVFVDWRDQGQVPQRNVQPWISAPSGAYLTWLAYRDDLSDPAPNDVDVVVNANVLYVLGKAGEFDAPGVTDAVLMINAATQSGAHLTDPNTISLYYPDNLVLHYAVSRAYGEGGMTNLQPAVDELVDDLIATVEPDGQDGCFWDRGAADLNTAMGALTLLNAGDREDLVQCAVRYLIARQDRRSGGWEPGVFFVGRLDNGTEVSWVSPALTTAMAMEALCRFRLLNPPLSSPVVPERPATPSVRTRQR